MKILKKAIIGLLLIIGLPVIVLTALDILNVNKDADEKEGAIVTLIFLGLVPSGIGGFMLWSMYDNSQRKERDRLRAEFFQLVKAGRGRISAFDFSMASGLGADASRLYLNERARNFNAASYVDEDGGIFYQFQLGYADLNALLDDPDDELPTYRVLLQTVPPDHEEEILQVLQDVMEVEAEAIKEVLGEPLMPVQIGVTLEHAQDYRQRLEEAGAKVLVVLE